MRKFRKKLSNFIKQSRGITIVSLVVTIIVLIIIAGITINFTIDDNGFMKQTEIIKERTEVSVITEELKLEVSKVKQKEGNITLDKYLKTIEENNIIKKENIQPTEYDNAVYVTVEDKYTFLVQDKGNDHIKIIYQGTPENIDNLAPEILDVKLSNTNNSIIAKVETLRFEEGDYKYYIKDTRTGNYELVKTSKLNEYTYENLLENKTYYLKIEIVTKDGKTDELELSYTIKTIELASEATKNPDNWTNTDVIVTLPIKEGYITEYQIGKSVDLNGKWVKYDSNNKIEIKENTQVFYRYKDGAESGPYATLVVDNIDKILPTVTMDVNGGKYTILAGDTTAEASVKLTVNDEGGSNLDELQYAWSTQNTNEPTNYTTFKNDETIKKGLLGGNTYLWLKVTDKAGNRAQIRLSNAFIINYQIAYNTNGGKEELEAQEKEYGKNITLSTTIPTREDYKFEGWSTNSNATTVEYLPGATYSIDSSVMLYAVWTANTYTVVYDGNGATSGSTASSTHTYDVAKNLTANGFERTGHTFAGWATTRDGAKVYNNEESVVNLSSTNGETVTLYAVWTLNTYSISYNLNGGSVATANPTSYNVTSNDITLNNPTRTGYTFAGWTGSNGTTAQTTVTIAKGSTGDKSYTANWTANTNTSYKVIHQQMGLDGETYETVKTENKTGTTATSVTPAVKSYTGFTAPEAQTVTIAADGSTTVTYKYTRNKYAYTLESGTGVTTTGSTASGNYYYGATITLKATANSGYTWSKWTSSNTDLVASTTTANTTFTMPAGAVTMTPSATENTYTIAFNANGGSGTMSSITEVKYTTATTLTANTFTRTGYTFEGWATSSSGAKVYDDKASVSKLTATNGETITLYAKWVDNVAPSAPTITAKIGSSSGSTYTSGNWTNKNIYVSLSSLDASGIAKYEWKEGLSGTWKTTSLTTSNNVGTITFTANRNSTIYFRATDGAENVSSESSIVIRKETTAPTCEITANTSDTTNASTITYTFTFSEAVTGFTADDITVTNGTKGIFTANSSTVYTLVVTNTGTCTQTVSVEANKCTDVAGNGNTTTSKSITVDKTAPEIVLTASTNDWTNGNVTVTASFSDNIGVTSKTLTCNGTSDTDYTLNGTESVVIKTNGKTVTATAEDSVGNTTTKTLTINNIDKVAPTVKAYGGAPLCSDPYFQSGTNGINVYNNNGNGTVTITRKEISGTYYGYGLEIQTTGDARPGHGGFTFNTQSSADKEFITVINAKIPQGYKIEWASNSIGDSPTMEWLTSNEGTGEWSEYIVRVKCGSTGTFWDTNYYYLTGGDTATASAPVTWQVRYADVIDTTAYATRNYIVYSGQDTENKIVAVGINQSNTTQPTWNSWSSMELNKSNIFGSWAYPYTTNGTYYVWMKDKAGNVSNTAITLNHIDTTAPTIETYTYSCLETDFSKYTLGDGAYIENNELVISKNNYITYSDYYYVQGKKWWIEFKGYTDAASSYWGPSGGALNYIAYFDANKDIKVANNNGRQDNGWTYKTDLNKWTSFSYGPRYSEYGVYNPNEYGFGDDIHYVRFGFYTDGYYSLPITRYKDIKFYTEAETSNYSKIIEVTVTDNNAIKTKKYLEETRTIEDFASNGIEFNEKIEITTNGMYTIYVEDIAGNASIKVVEIKGII